MTAVILAAGYGSRLRPLTESQHKTMVSVAGERIIDRIVSSLILASVYDVVVVLGYRGEELRGHLESSYAGVLRFTFVENHDFHSTNNIHSLALALDFVQDDFLLIECDLFFEKELLRDLIAFPSPNAALTARYRTGMDGTVLSVDSDGLVEAVFPTYAQGSKFDFSDKLKTLNVYKLSKDFLNGRLRSLVDYYVKAHSTKSYYEVVLGIIIYLRSAEIRAFDVSNRRWMEIDDMNDLAKAEYMFCPEGRYETLCRDHGGYWNVDVLDFCYLRNMYFPTRAMFGDIRYNLEKLLCNYGSCQTVLNRKLAYHLLVPQDACCLLNGASQGIELLPGLFKTDQLVTFAPTFDEYLSVFGKVDICDGERESLLTLVSRAARHHRSVILLTNPCNPTGRCHPLPEIIEFVEASVQRGISVVVDESFIDFAGEQSGSISQFLLERRPPGVLVIKSLSKSLGVPGIRLGYALSGDSRLMTELNSQLPLWNTNSVAEYFLELLLKYGPELEVSFQKTIHDREAFFTQLRETGQLEPQPSGGNFILCRLTHSGISAAELARQLLLRDNILIKDCTRKYPAGSGEFIRLAVRLPEENLRLVQGINRAFAELGSEQKPHTEQAGWKEVWLRKGQSFSGRLNYSADDLFSADGFDSALGKTTEAGRAHIARLIQNALGISKGKKILEVGCGAGAVISLLLESGAEFAGVDYSEPHIEIARRALSAVDFQVSEAAVLPFDQGKFDAVFSHGVFLYFNGLDYAARVIAEMVRVGTSSAPIFIMDVPDAATEEECVEARRAAGASLQPAHLYYPMEFFKEVASRHSRRAIFSRQTVPGYGNSAYRYNVLLEPL